MNATETTTAVNGKTDPTKRRTLRFRLTIDEPHTLTTYAVSALAADETPEGAVKALRLTRMARDLATGQDYATDTFYTITVHADGKPHCHGTHCTNNGRPFEHDMDKCKHLDAMHALHWLDATDYAAAWERRALTAESKHQSAEEQIADLMQRFADATEEVERTRAAHDNLAEAFASLHTKTVAADKEITDLHDRLEQLTNHNDDQAELIRQLNEALNAYQEQSPKAEPPAAPTDPEPGSVWF
jgi:hypothetical protein